MYDLDPLQAGETRVKVLGMPSKEEWLFSAVTLHGRYFPDASKWVSK
jgi:hypothetical protein